MLKALMLRTTLIAFACSLSFAAYALADGPKKWIDIPAGDLTTAIELFTKQSGVELIYRTEQLKGLRTQGVSGNLSAYDAITKLLDGTALALKTDESGAMLIAVPLPTRSPVSGQEMTSPMATEDGATATPATGVGWFNRFRLAQTDNPEGSYSGTEKKDKSRKESSGQDPSALAGGVQGDPEFQRSVQVEEIVVTARKREENLQDVPISISVVSGEALQRGGIARLEALAPTIPNFFYSEAVASNDQLFIRGLGSGVNLGFENSVGQVIDGFFFGRSRYGRAAFLDVQQVEILKGPQGALIGKNTTAGVINIRTAKPTDTFQAYLIPTWEFEGDEGYTVEGAVSGPLNERFKGRIAFRNDDRDGYYRNVITGQKEMQRDNLSLRGIGDLTLTDNLNAVLLYQYGKEDRDGRNYDISICGAAELAVLAPAGENCRFDQQTSSVNRRNGVINPVTTNTTFHIAGLTVNWDVGPLGTITSLTGYSGYETADVWGGPAGPFESGPLNIYEDYSQWSQEIRLASTGENVVDYLVGGFYLSNDQNSRFIVNFNLNGPAPLFPVLPPAARATNNRVTDQDGDTKAVFAQAIWHLTPQWDLTGGIRYTHESKDAHQREFPTVLYTDTPRAAPPAGPASNVHDFTDSRTEKQFTPNLSLQWQPNDQVMLYGSVGRGFKGGGFDQQISGPPSVIDRFEFDDEQVTAYELGGKFTLFSGTAQLNVALFRGEFEDLQVSTLLPIPGNALFKVGNAASAISQGLEAEFRWRPTERLRIFATFAYLNAEFDEYQDAPCYSLQTVAQGCVAGVQDLSGRELQFSPEWTGSLNGGYTWPLLGNLEVVAFAQAYYKGKHSLVLTLDPKGFQESYTKMDASLALGRADGKWQVSVIGRNLTDELTANFGNLAFTQAFFRFAEPPRSIAVQARFNF